MRLTAADRRANRFASKYVPDVVVLLTDGAATTGVDPRVAARQAADRRIRVFTIGFGTTEPSPLVCSAEQFGGEDLGPPGGGLPATRLRPRPQRGNFLEIDEATLRSIARTTGGSYRARRECRSARAGVRQSAPRVVTVKEVHELTVFLVGLGALLAVGAVATSRWWNRFS